MKDMGSKSVVRGRKIRTTIPRLFIFLCKWVLLILEPVSPSHKLCKPPERCKIESTDQEVLLWQEEIEIRNVKQSGKR